MILHSSSSPSPSSPPPPPPLCRTVHRHLPSYEGADAVYDWARQADHPIPLGLRHHLLFALVLLGQIQHAAGHGGEEQQRNLPSTVSAVTIKKLFSG